MLNRHKTMLGNLLKDRVSFDVPLEGWTTFRVGGRAAAVVEPAGEEELGVVLKFARDQVVALEIIGRGSNLLVSDAGFHGILVRLREGFSSVRLVPGKGGGVCCECGAGVSLSTLQGRLLRDGLGGFEFAAGIPGTMGGAVGMNAGSRWGSMADTILWVEWMSRQGGKVRRARRDLEFGYRSLRLPPGAVILKAAMKVNPKDARESREEIRRYMKYRLETQPVGEKSAGSVFLNPPGRSAGRLIDEAGLKGLRLGDAVVSTKHANFIVNAGKAKAAQIKCLMDEVVRRVEQTSGIRLTPEIRLLGPFE
jgi:UDP-N-acetylmuramate dehydrogenase